MADDVDVATNAMNSSLEGTLLMRRRAMEQEAIARRTIEVNTAISRACVDCGDRIPRERLLASPRTVRCSDCQEEAEAEQRRH